jgi:dipeptidyl aminopeptidase/acylaminoacyl peptidase
MTTSDRFERRLPEILEEISLPRKPDYFDDLVGLSARTRQRPAWSILERWLPVVDMARQPAFARQVPWRPIAVLALILLLIGATLAWVAGSQHPLPAPFGPARNGLVVYSKDGDIYTADPVTGTSTAIVKGPENDTNPRWSDDGTSVVFERVAGGSTNGDVYVAGADGSKPVRVTTAQPLAGISTYDFSPNGKQILITAVSGAIPAVFIAQADGSGIRQLEVPGRVTNAAWRPPDGSEILVMDDGADQNGTDTTIYAVSVADGKVRTILPGADADGRFRGHAIWSPDGSRIAFGEWTGVNNVPDVHTHIVKADGTGDMVLPTPSGAVWETPFAWSNDGTRLLATRGYTGGADQSRPVIVPVDGSGPGVEIGSASGFGSVSDWTWAPDDSSILGTPSDSAGTVLAQVLLDPVTHTARTLPWVSVSQPSWQRIAP